MREALQASLSPDQELSGYTYTLRRAKMAESDWSACPREILYQCFAIQTDYYDNKPADLTCRAWHDEMLGVALAHRHIWSTKVHQTAFKGLTASGFVLSDS
ncbi:hypothetical protein WJX77_008624 [Trebouxia sp. C0004]